MTARLAGGFLVVSIAAAMALSSPPQAVAAVLTVSPVRVELRTWPGAIERRSIFLTNDGDSTLTVEVSLADYRKAADGSAAFTAPGLDALSCARWISVPSGPVILPAGVRREVLLEVSVPSEAALGRRQAAVLLSTARGSAGAIAVGRVAVLVNLSVEAKPTAAGSAPTTMAEPAARDSSTSAAQGLAPETLSAAVRWLAVVAGVCFVAGVGLLLVDVLHRRRRE